MEFVGLFNVNQRGIVQGPRSLYDLQYQLEHTQQGMYRRQLRMHDRWADADIHEKSICMKNMAAG